MPNLPDIGKIRIALAGRPAMTRFAPSPTGYLHLGHVVHALYVWGIARALGGKVVLRMENHDRIRCKPEYETALLEDLEWLGLAPDIGLPSEFRRGATEFRQSDCNQAYLRALQRLQADGQVYACDCSRKRILARTQQMDVDELRYDGFCRDRGLLDGPSMTLRLRIPDQQVVFEDMWMGSQAQNPQQQIGDVAIRDNHGHWTYQFAVVVDDIRNRINLIVRGMDILSSTGRQIMLREQLGGDSLPVYFHHPLLTDKGGRKLSKRDFDADIHTLMIAGVPASAVIGKAAYLAGWIADEHPLELEDILRMFHHNDRQ